MKIIKEKRRAFKDQGARDIILAGLIALVFALGVLLGGMISSAKYKTIEKECMAKLESHQWSIVLINGDIADSVGFKPRDKHDQDLREAKWEQ